MPLHPCSIHQQCLYTLVQHISNAFTSLFNTPAMRLHSCSTHQQCFYTLVQHASNAFTLLFNIPAMRLHPCSTCQQCVCIFNKPFQQYVYTLVQHSSNVLTSLFNLLAARLYLCAFTPFFNIPAIRLHPCSVHQQYVYTLVQQISNTSTPLFNKPTMCNYTLLQRTSNLYNLHRSSTTTSAPEPLFNDQQCIDPLPFLFRKVVVCGHCLVTLSITSYWNIKMGLIAAHLNAGIILVVTV